ncbi:ATP-dependent helicase/nuclease subunit A [Paenibacillus shirakamiensis]|uniref:ATP-dependent helicase/nuclease subunit A n=1 Tax=Paenibacillus shirakamiensis TaxID=1265935 RepID=A0ABS4JBR7_9BACL|nr:helicase-exonuclease AddAB subunit AddA [Paenibacillus shirakamiensis]MBP1999157.1 ATP-dependent helicase/nuclease subunit A [Paenibacillus shirakamiensis]
MTMLSKPLGSKWSDDQWKAIAMSGGNMLIAAAAGSGKTAVLVERIIRKILDKESPLDVDRLLVATFTKAAASEMRERIRVALEEALDQDPSNEHLGAQLAMLGKASITTLHSFCLEVIQRYYTLIPLDPGFRIASEIEVKLLRQEVLEALFEEKYGTEDKDSRFLQLVDWFSGERSDDAMFLLVHKLYDFSRSHAWPDHWLMHMAEQFERADINTLSESLWVKSILADTRLTLSGVYDLLQQAKTISLSPGGPAPYAISLNEDLEVIEGLREALEYQPWDHLYHVFQYANFGKLKPCKKDQADPLLQDRVKGLREEAKKTLAELRGQLFGRSAEAFVEELLNAAPLMRELSELIIEFGRRYQAEKQAKGWLDFSDLEHYCLHILRSPASTPDSTLPSAAALEYQAQYEEVLLDEYQDTNTVQESIVELIAKKEQGNRFMVGDVKQSIYRFRLAEPGLFLDKYKTYDEDFTGKGLRIDLARNFRSRREVVQAVNLLFRQLMNENIAEITYDERAELVYGEGFPESAEVQSMAYAPELLLIDRSRSEEENARGESNQDFGESAGPTGEDASLEEAEELEAVRLEARMIAARIREMTGEGRDALRVYDKHLGTTRPAVYKDMVILLRSTLSWAPAIIQELRMEGIPAYGEVNKGYFQASEVEIMLSLLHVIDNPQQDIAMASVLRSPMYGLSEEELAEIRLARPQGGFYEAVQVAAGWVHEKMPDRTHSQKLSEHETELASTEIEDTIEGPARPTSASQPSLSYKLQSFLKQLESWRTLARQGELGRLIRNVYQQTRYVEWVGGLPGGEQRQANLRALHDRALQYEQSTGSRGLFRFLRHVDRMRQSGSDFGAPGTGEQADGIRIMTIHKSKGLEFPVVFVAGLSKMFNRQDMNASFLVHKELGFGPKYVDAKTRVSYPTLPNLAIRRRAQMELLAEELRVLYVALTRPKDKLVLVSSVKDLTKSASVWSQAIQSQTTVLPDYMLARGRSYMDWIGPALIRHPDAYTLRALAGLEESQVSLSTVPGMDFPWRIMTVSSRDMLMAAPTLELSEQEGGDLAQLRSFLSGKPEVVQKLTTSKYTEEAASRLEWKYQHTMATQISAKTSVTEMKQAFSEEQPSSNVFEHMAMQGEMESAQLKQQEPVFSLHMHRPKFMEQRKMTPTERGTAYHMVMQHLPFHPAEPEKTASDTLARLAELQILPEGQVLELNKDQIAGFLRSPLGQRASEATWVRREIPFSYGLPAISARPVIVPLLESAFDEPERLAAQMFRELEEEKVLIQGVIDCLFCHEGKWILLDYKSDRILEHQGGIPALKERYRFQLEIYAEAIEHIIGQQVDELWLYFFEAGEAVKLD